MKIKVGTKNPAKIEAVKETIELYDFLKGAEVEGLEVTTGVPEQPKGIEEIAEGATTRARNAFQDCDLSIGIESGLIPVPKSLTGYLDISLCAIYDGEKFYVGTSAGFECPPAVTKLMLEKGLDMNQASYQAGLTDNPKVGSAEGSIGVLTKGRLTRKSYTKQAIITALIHLENK